MLRAAQRSNDIDAEIDGMPMGDVDGMAMEESAKPDSPPKMLFAPSKWETVDPSEVESQAMTTSKWDILDESKASGKHLDGEAMQQSSEREGYDRSITPSPGHDTSPQLLMDRREMSEEKRARLRVIETKVMLYQDELESGQRPVKAGYTLSSQVDRYRKKLLHKAEKEIRNESKEPEKRTPHGTTSYSRVSEEDERYQYRHQRSRSKSPPSSSRSRQSRSSKKNRSISRSPRYQAYSKERDHLLASPPLNRRHSPTSRSQSRSPPRKHRRKSSRR